VLVVRPNSDRTGLTAVEGADEDGLVARLKDIFSFSFKLPVRIIYES
jgi:hypothetical protein